MPYSETIADQVRQELAHLPDTHEIKMYGGIAFMVNNKMFICVGGSDADNVMVRVGSEAYEDALRQKGAHPTVMKDKPVKGYVDLDSDGRKDLSAWVKRAQKFNETLIAKEK